MPLITPDTRSIYWAIESGNIILKTGSTPLGAITATGYTVRQAESENDFLNELSGNEGDFPALPVQGEEVTIGSIYNDNGTLFLCRQTHNRTEHDPTTIPALFATYQVGADNLQWVENELVAVGTIREYLGTLYKCIQAHQTQSDWTPTATLGVLWSEYVEPGEGVPDWQPWTGLNEDLYQIGDEVMHNGQHWVATTGNNHWEPGVFGWELVV